MLSRVLTLDDHTWTLDHDCTACFCDFPSIEYSALAHESHVLLAMGERLQWRKPGDCSHLGRVNTTKRSCDSLRDGNHATTGRLHRTQPFWSQGEGRQQQATRAQCLCICGRAWRQMARLALRFWQLTYDRCPHQSLVQGWCVIGSIQSVSKRRSCVCVSQRSAATQHIARCIRLAPKR